MASPFPFESMAFQAALVGLVYLITYGLIKTIGSILPPDAAKIMWGFLFVFGLLIAVLIGSGIRKWGMDICRIPVSSDALPAGPSIF
jgi:hypothetical protein